MVSYSFQEDAEADAFMRIFNADGGEAKQCGNGLRCVRRSILFEIEWWIAQRSQFEHFQV